MKRLVGILILMIVIGVEAGAQDSLYNAGTIPEALKKNASVIKRYEKILYEVTDLDHASTTIHKVITVMNDKGADALQFQEYVDKINQLDDVEIKVFNSMGKQLNKYKQKDMQTTIAGSGLIDDGKVVYFIVPISTYPVTVEFKYVLRHRGTLFYPRYELMNFGESVQFSTYTARVPKELGLRFKEKNIDLKPESGEDGKQKWYTWKVSNLKAIEYEEGSMRSAPYILMAPNRFKLHDYEGDLSSWKSFGKWYGQLYKGRDVLPPKTVEFFKDLVKDVPDPKNKARKIYEYLQKNFRYVSISLGIGGLQPFSAEFTDQKKYGDCKSLSNYMKAALSCIGIKSYTAVINAGANGVRMDEDFPLKFSNHVILCMPLEKDTVWLECTSNTIDFGVLGNFTENRNAMLITEDGGVLVSTPTSRAADNYFNAKTTITLKEDGSGATATEFKATGEFKEHMSYMVDEKEDDKKRYIVRDMGFKQPDAFAFTKDESAGGFSTTLQMSLEKVPEFIAGNKMFIAPKLYKLWMEKLPNTAQRRQDYYFSYPFDKTDTTIIKLPEGFSIDALPKPKELSCALASYTTKYWFSEEQKAVYSTTHMVLKQQQIPAVSYAEVKKFFDDVLLDDAQRIVIKKL